MRSNNRTGGAGKDCNAIVPIRSRILATFTIGIAAGGLTGLKAFGTVLTTTTDFEVYWLASRLFARGINPYPLRAGDPSWPLSEALFYPAPALLVVWPLHLFILPVAAGAFFGTASGLLAWRLSRDGLWRLWMLGTPAFIMAAILGQWSPFLVVGALIPGAGFLLACKPTIGLACFIYRPTWITAISVAGISFLSLILLPTWPLEWLTNIQIIANHPRVDHPSPITQPFGWLLLLAAIRWRQPEARLLFAMACVPQLLYFADQLALGLVARKRSEAVALAWCGLLAAVTWFVLLPVGVPHVAPAAPYVMAGLYLPALIVVLSRSNEGPVPAWVDRALGKVATRAGRLPKLYRSQKCLLGLSDLRSRPDKNDG